MKLLVLTQAYPTPQGDVSLAYVRTRNVFYKSQGADVDVINFNTDSEYIIDNIKVYPQRWFKKVFASSYDLLICHAPNLRNHYRFLRKYGELFPNKVFFFHGHEVLKINKVYSKPYPFVKQNIIRKWGQNFYDDIKLKIWNKYFTDNIDSCHFIFVSNWMRTEFYKWVKIKPELFKRHEYITYNSVGEIFEKETFSPNLNKSYDFATIRSMLDGSKYSVDIVNNLAWNNPQYKFLLIGKGDFFKHYTKAPNLTWIDQRLNHSQIIEHLNDAACALMPTRTDAQGVMMCEMAAFGMPVITSNIPVCHEVFNHLPSVRYIDNEKLGKQSVKDIYEPLKGTALKDSRYFYSKVCMDEYAILKRILEQ